MMVDTRRRMVAPPPLAPHVPTPHGLRWPDLTQAQAGVLYVVGFHAEDDGVFRHPQKRLVLMVGLPGSAGALNELAGLDLIARVDGNRPGWRLTRDGRAMFREMSGEREL